MEQISKMKATLHKLTRGEFSILIRDLHKVALRAQRSSVVFDHSAALSELKQAFSMDTLGVKQHTTAVNHADYLFLTHEDLVRAKIPIRTTSHKLGTLALFEVQFPLYAFDIGTNRTGGHAVGIVGHPTQGGRLARSERFP